MSNPVAELIRERARSRPAEIALTMNGRSTTWAELHGRACQTANAMRALGIQPQDRVAFIDKNGVDYFVFLFGCALCAAVSVPVSWRFTQAELAATIADAQVRLVIVGDEFVSQLGDVTTKSLQYVALGEHATWPRFAAWIAEHPTSDPQVRSEGDAVAMQLYTSGTTGLPKGVLIDAKNLRCLMDELGPKWDLRVTDTTFVCMPLFHMGGVGWALAGMKAGCRSVIVREFVPAAVLDTLVSERATIAFFVPAMLAFLCAVPGASERPYALRRIVYSGSPITQQALMTAMSTFRCAFVQIYGMTETSGSFAQLEPEDHQPDGPRSHLLRSAGRPYPWVEVRIVETSSGGDCPVGQVGEIWTRSAQNTRGYWNNENETSALVAEDGWLRTGDAGFRDEEGYLFLTDRIKDMIISGGENVYPAEVENALASHPSVAEVAVIGVPSDKWGETVKAIVAARPGATIDEEQLIKHARDRLAGFKCPTSIDVISALPRSPTGKVLKKDLREPHWVGKQRRIN